MALPRPGSRAGLLIAWHGAMTTARAAAAMSRAEVRRLPMPRLGRHARPQTGRGMAAMHLAHAAYLRRAMARGAA